MLEHHGGIETVVPHFRKAVAPILKAKLMLHALVAAFRGDSGVISFLSILGRDVKEPGASFTARLTVRPHLASEQGVEQERALLRRSMREQRNLERYLEASTPS